MPRFWDCSFGCLCWDSVTCGSCAKQYKSRTAPCHVEQSSNSNVKIVKPKTMQKPLLRYTRICKDINKITEHECIQTHTYIFVHAYIHFCIHARDLLDIHAHTPGHARAGTCTCQGIFMANKYIQSEVHTHMNTHTKDPLKYVSVHGIIAATRVCVCVYLLCMYTKLAAGLYPFMTRNMF